MMSRSGFAARSRFASTRPELPWSAISRSRISGLQFITTSYPSSTLSLSPITFIFSSRLMIALIPSLMRA